MEAVAVKKQTTTAETAELRALFAELDKGIDDMEAGRVVPHEEAMREIRQMVKNYASHNRSNKRSH